MPKLAVISHSAVVSRFREKWHALSALGWEVHLILPQHWPEGGGRVVAPATGSEGSLRIYRLPIWLAGKVFWFHVPGIFSQLRRIQPDLVYAEEEPQALLTQRLAKFCSKQNRPLAAFTWENIPQTFTWPLHGGYLKLLRTIGGMICGNHEALEILRSRGLRAPAVALPQYGVNTQKFAPGVSNTAPSERLRIGFLGRFTAEKGLATLLEAARLLRVPYQLTLAGRGPLEPALRQALQESPLAGHAEIRTSVQHAEVPEFLRGLDVLVLPSLTRPKWKEQFGRVLIEAMACAVLTLGSESGEIPHVIGDPECVFPEGNAASLAALLRRAAEDPDWRQARAQAGRARAVAEYDERALARRYHAFFSEISGCFKK
jgi:glycosyltransferase involved in cell wall biosynthesis